MVFSTLAKRSWAVKPPKEVRELPSALRRRALALCHPKSRQVRINRLQKKYLNVVSLLNDVALPARP